MALLRSVRIRLTLWYVLLLAVTLAVFSAGVYAALRRSLYANLDESLEGRAEIVGGLVAAEGGLDTAGLDIPGDPVEGEEFARVFAPSGDLVFDNSAEPFRPPADPDAVRAALSGETARRHVDAAGVRLRVMTAPVRTDAGIIGAVEVGLSEDDARDTLHTLLVIMALAYPLVLVVTSAGGVFLENGERVESTLDCFAQHRDGSVYYFGERVDEYERGRLVDHGGQWLAGEGENRPGVFMPAQSGLGEVFGQERAPGVAEDRSPVVALGQTVALPAGTSTGCIQTRDHDPLAGVTEHKYYCPGVGLVREEFDAGHLDLISY